MRRPFTTAEALKSGITKSALEWGARKGRWVRVEEGVYLPGPDLATLAEHALCLVEVTGGIATGSLAGVLHELDSVELAPAYATVAPTDSCHRDGVRRAQLRSDRIVEVAGYRCTDGTQTMIDLARHLDDLQWEQALESALRKKITTIDLLEEELERIRPMRMAGVRRVRRVLELRPEGARPTESLLETLAVQLIRKEPRMPTPERQVEVYDEFGQFCGRADLAWLDAGVFIECDGRQHDDQQEYDTQRETAIVAATGWIPGRFRWRQITTLPRTTLRRMRALYERGLENSASRSRYRTR